MCIDGHGNLVLAIVVKHVQQWFYHVLIVANRFVKGVAALNLAVLARPLYACTAGIKTPVIKHSWQLVDDILQR